MGMTHPEDDHLQSLNAEAFRRFVDERRDEDGLAERLKTVQDRLEAEGLTVEELAEAKQQERDSANTP